VSCAPFLSRPFALITAVVVAWAAACASDAFAQSVTQIIPDGDTQVDNPMTVRQRLGDSVDLTRSFTTSEGKTVKLGDLFGDKPVLMTLNYYGCAGLCTAQLNALSTAIKTLEVETGDFRIVTISIDPRDDAEIASMKREAYLEDAARAELDWQFLVGEESNIRAVADSVGYAYAWDDETQQYNHGAALLVVSPDGKLTRYLGGLYYEPRDLKFALIDAGDGRVGSIVDQVFLSCFTFDPATGSYRSFAWGIMRLGGIATLVILGGAMFFLFRGEKKRVVASDEPLPSQSEQAPAADPA
jgi:protein SCO1/2